MSNSSFEPLLVRAKLNNGLARFDPWSPALDSLLVYLILSEYDKLSPNPTIEDWERNKDFLIDKMPLELGFIGDDWYWKSSSPITQEKGQYTDRYRKRWDYQEYALNWGKRKAKWETSQNAEKSYDLPLYCINATTLSWYVVGEKQELERLLSQCLYLGKKRSYGNGQVNAWEVIPTEKDYHLFKDGKLMRPMPYSLIAPFLDLKVKYDLLHWGWKPPVFLPQNQALCAVP